MSDSPPDTLGEKLKNQQNEAWPYAVEKVADKPFKDVAYGFKTPTDDIYAGADARRMIEHCRHDPEQPRWIGVSDRSAKPAPLSFDSQFRHTFVGGQTGTGKSTCLMNIYQHYVEGGHGACFIDPKGDDVITLARRIPEERHDDIIFISPGEDSFGKSVGFNLLDTESDPGDPGFDAEVEGIVDDLVALLRAGDFWGPRMDGVAKNMIRAMATHSANFTPLEIYYALLDEESRQEYASLVRTSDIDFIQGYADKISELADEDLDAIVRRFQSWVENPIARQVIAQRESSISLAEAVEEEKLILVKNDLPSDEAKQMVATAILRQIWTAVSTRPSPDEQRFAQLADADETDGEIEDDADAEYTPYFLIIDECDDVLTDASKIDTMLSKARSKRLGLTLATQALHQLDETAQDAILSNCNTLLTYNPGHPTEAKTLARRFGDKTAEDLTELGNFRAWTRIDVNNGELSDPFLVRAFPPYPPRMDHREAFDVLSTSLDRYGIVPPTSEEIREQMYFGGGGSTDDGPTIELDDDRKALVYKRVYDERLRTNWENKNNEDNQQNQKNWTNQKNPIPFDSLREHIRQACDADDASEGALQDCKDRLVDGGHLHESTDDDGTVCYSVESEGVAEIYRQGASPTAGKERHRRLVRRMYPLLVGRAGLDVEVGIQGGSESMPDLLAHPRRDIPGNPIAAQDALDEFKSENPLGHTLTRGAPTAVEIEKATADSPAKTASNLESAIEDDRRCLFVVPGGGGDEPAAYAEKVWSTMMGDRVPDVPKERWSILVLPTDDHDEPWFYTPSRTPTVAEMES